MRWTVLAALALAAGVLGTVRLAKADDVRPLFARTDEAIAFLQSDEERSVRVMLPNGTRVRRVVRRAFGVDSPTWSPDGRRLAYVNSTPGPTLYVLDIRTGRTTRVTDDDTQSALYPAWSPDGRWIAFVNGRDITVVRPNGSGLRRVTRAPFQDYWPTWSPDSRSIAFMRDRATFDSDIYRVPVAGGAVTRLTATGGSNSAPAWSPCGDAIAYVREPINGGRGEIWLMRPDGSDQRRPVDDPDAARDPAWSPDCAWIAFTRGGHLAGEVGDGAEIYAMRPDGSDFKRITKNDQPDSDPAWTRVR